MIPPREAWNRLAPHLTPLEQERVPRREARGRVLARPLPATVDVPAADVSAMDGFALGREVEAGERLRIVGTVAAGDPPGLELDPRHTVRIMTGAPVPIGADRVVPVEQTDTDGRTVVFPGGAARGAHIRRRGEVLGAGQPLLPGGVVLTPAALSLLATHGHQSLPVHRRPRVGILVTGDEVVPPEDEPQPGQLRDSHTDFLLAAGGSLGLQFAALGIAPDHRERLEAAVAEGLRHDVLLVTGGVSKGEYDFLEAVLAGLGCSLLFDSVAIQPGKPLVAARHETGLVFGLPGNPASVMTCFWLFVRPALRRLQGIADGYWRGALAGRLETDLPGAKDRDRFLAARARFENGILLVSPRPAKGSHDVAAYGQGSVLVKVPAHAAAAGPGDPCEVLPLVDWPEE